MEKTMENRIINQAGEFAAIYVGKARTIGGCYFGYGLTGYACPKSYGYRFYADGQANNFEDFVESDLYFPRG